MRKADKGLYYGEPRFIYRRILTSQLQVIKKSQWEKYKYVEDMQEDLDFVMHHMMLSKYYVIHLYGYRQRTNSYLRQIKIGIMTRRVENGYYYSLYKKN